MGFSITWCAVREEDAQPLLNDLQLSPTGKTEEFPESPVSVAQLATGWRIIRCNEYGSPLFNRQNLASLSSTRDILLCLVEEHVMASSSEFWSEGKRQWLILHEGENGPKGLDADGDLPACFASVKTEMEQAQQAEGGEQGEVDYLFEIPLKVAQSLVGFKHDEDCPHISEDRFVVLSLPSAKKGFLGRLFGK